jgi:acetyltransferase-like isoleucine patch superfamily enzyme
MENPFSAGYYHSEELRRFGFKSIGENVAIAKACNIVGLQNIEIGDNVRIDAYCSLIAANGFIRLGSYIHIGGYCHFAGRGGITMGDFSGLSQRTSIYSASDDYSGRHMTNPMVPAHLTRAKVAPVAIGRHAIVGSGSVILPGVELAEGVAVGALALVTHSQPEWTVCAGNPARVLRQRHRKPLVLEQQLSRMREAA